MVRSLVVLGTDLDIAKLKNAFKNFEVEFHNADVRDEGLEDCANFLIPVNSRLEILYKDMARFAPVFFGSLHLAFGLDSSNLIERSFVGTILNSPSAGRHQYLHFYNVEGNGGGTKREAEIYKRLREAVVEPANIRRPWCENLLVMFEDIGNCSVLVKSCSDCFIIKDGYPKSKHHYLCIPRKRIDTWKHLTLEDVPLLERMNSESAKFVKDLDPEAEFMFGFHVIPSMKQLHLHLISKDHDSPTLETSFQWNAFHTEFLVSVPEVISELGEKGAIVVDQDRYAYFWSLLKTPLRCVICLRQFRRISSLKKHYTAEYRDLRSLEIGSRKRRAL